MKLDVPFFKQTTPLNCGPCALKMVLSYFGDDHALDLLEEKTELIEGKGIYTIQIGTAAARLGYKATFYSKHISFNPAHMDLDFYKNFSAMTPEQSDQWIMKAKQAGVVIEEKSLPLKELLATVTQQSVPIILLDWNVVKLREDKGYQGHFVPIVGFDTDFVYIHNHGMSDTQAFMSVPRDIFDRARKSNGTDEDVVIIYRR